MNTSFIDDIITNNINLCIDKIPNMVIDIDLILFDVKMYYYNDTINYIII